MVVTLRDDRLEKELEENRVYLYDDIVFEGKSGKYTILYDEQISCGGESLVYLARREADGEKVVAKIYDRFQDNKETRKIRNKVIDFVSENNNYRESHLLPILDYGFVELDSEDGVGYRFPVDIIPFCEGGNLKKADYKTLKYNIIPALAKAVNLMHENNLMHRDIKPENIYMYNGEAVLADFGTACEIDNASLGLHVTSVKRGSIGYMAPEAFQRFAVPSSDFYSLGCTIASLYNGKHVHYKLMKKDDFGLMYSAIHTNGMPLLCPDSEKDIQVLVDALINADPKTRAGYKDIMLWLGDSKAFEHENKYTIRNNKKDEKIISFVFEDKTYTTQKELAEALSLNWKKAEPYLYRGGVRNSVLVNSFSSINQSLAIKLGDIIESEATATNYDLGLAKAIHYIDENGPLVWRGKQYYKLSEISDAIKNNEVTENDIVSMLASNYVSWKTRKNKIHDENQIGVIEEIEEIAKSHPSLAYNLVKYCFALNVNEQSYKGLMDPDEIFNMVTRSVKKFYDEINSILYDDDMLAFVAFLGNFEIVKKYKDNCSGVIRNDLEYFYRLFEVITDDKKSVRDHYIKYGPSSYLTWLQANISLYEFKDSKGKTVKDKITSISFDSNMKIDAISEKFFKLKEYEKDFKNMFQGNILLTYLGLSDEKKSIVSNNSDAFFVDEFIGISVPTGFVRFINKA
ncbi:MAG: protein kinase [Oscillospiraceae bacterium]|nr:protein kinase [Oscillospiraceae bacterium]